MQVIQFSADHAPELASAAQTTKDASAFYWIEIERSEKDWHDKAQPWLNMQLHERHIRDTLNETHPPYYDGTDDYDLLVVRTLCHDMPSEQPTTCPVAFVITANAVISIRPPENPVFHKLHQRFLSGQRKVPASPAMLLYQLLDQITDTLLGRRDTTTELLNSWQDRLLDRNDVFGDWQSLMRLRSQLRRLEVVTETQLDMISEWRDQTSMQLDSSLLVRFNDLQEHIRRVYNHAVVTQQDIDALVQIYFSANTQRTNEILQFLTIISAIFLPMNLLAGLFGMNFSHLPWLQDWYGPWMVGTLMLAIVTGLLLWFRHRRWI
ncbi:MAG: magnesium transporter CorA family protein [Chromatiales bacterium]|jgi:magnesium/cobalt transport protein CorA